MKKTKSQRRSARQALHDSIHENKTVFAVYVTIRVLVIAILVLSVLEGKYENTYICVLTLVLLMLPSIVEKRLGIKLPTGLEITVLLFIFAAEILGELEAFFVRVPFWDTMLHTISGFIYAAVGFAMVDILNENKRVSFSMSPLFMAFVAFCFSMTIGVLWEFFEFGMDKVFHLDMQKDTIIHTITSVTLDPTRQNIPVTISGITDAAVNGQSLGLGGYLDIGLIDTMKDLFVNFIGAVVFSCIGYLDVKHRHSSKVTSMFIPQVLDKPAEKDGKGEEKETESLEKNQEQ